MDVHPGLGDATPEDLAASHERDLAVQDKYGVRFLSYWLNEQKGMAFCLVEAPDSDMAQACHKEAHGLMPHDIIEVDAPTLAAFMGDYETNDADRVLLRRQGSEPDTGLRAIMFTDVEGSTDLSTRLGDTAALGVVHAHDSIVRMCLEDHGGREVKHTGDGILASFTSVAGAIRATVDIHGGADPEPNLAIKIGLSAGEPVSGGNDIYGAAVNLAARICAHAAGGQTLAASTIRDLSIGKDARFLDRGATALKGFPDPVRLFEVVREDGRP